MIVRNSSCDIITLKVHTLTNCR